MLTCLGSDVYFVWVLFWCIEPHQKRRARMCYCLLCRKAGACFIFRVHISRWIYRCAISAGCVMLTIKRTTAHKKDRWGARQSRALKWDCARLMSDVGLLRFRAWKRLQFIRPHLYMHLQIRALLLSWTRYDCLGLWPVASYRAWRVYTIFGIIAPGLGSQNGWHKCETLEPQYSIWAA